jgi:hypothetical protein
MSTPAGGFDAAMRYPLFDALFNRRSRRVMRGVREVAAGSLTYRSDRQPEPLSELEEAVLIAATGATGLTLPDRPFESGTGEKILGTPNLNMRGRAAGSTDNCQATHFFLINDSGTYLLEKLPAAPAQPLTPEVCVERARQAKKKVLDGRLEFPRQFPYYLDSNRFLSNLPGSTILLPVVEMTEQYINALMYLLTEPQGFRPTFLDDRNFYLPAGVRKWVSRKFLNPKLKVPLGVLGSMRTQIEADLLLQNLMLVIQAMGLGGWIHASVAPPYLLGNPYQSEQRGLGFRWVKPAPRLLDLFRWGTFLTAPRAHPVGLDGLLQALCPPYVKDMDEAVDRVVQRKYAPGGVYADPDYFNRIFRGDGGKRYLTEVPHYLDDVIACTKDVCRYVYDTHGRFPAHVDAIHVPGVWIQVHHLDLKYYDTLFVDGYTRTQADHQALWHSP